jgi:hypothetical protein
MDFHEILYCQKQPKFVERLQVCFRRNNNEHLRTNEHASLRATSAQPAGYFSSANGLNKGKNQRPNVKYTFLVTLKAKGANAQNCYDTAFIS